MFIAASDIQNTLHYKYKLNWNFVRPYFSICFGSGETLHAKYKISCYLKVTGTIFLGSAIASLHILCDFVRFFVSLFLSLS